MRKLSETDPVSLLFASKRKKYLSETGAPYLLSTRKVVAKMLPEAIKITYAVLFLST
jgi:hypothetical protein